MALIRVNGGTGVTVTEIIPSGYEPSNPISYSGLEIGATYAISFGKLSNATSQDLALTGATILYQNRDGLGGSANANYGIAIIKATATTVTSTGTNAMQLGSKIYKIG